MRLPRAAKWCACGSCLGLPTRWAASKIPFPNANDIYLHDTPTKSLFTKDDRNLSHGCIRLRMPSVSVAGCSGANPKRPRRDPEQNVLVPTPTPIYLTYVTAQVKDGQLSFTDDPYRRDAQSTALAN